MDLWTSHRLSESVRDGRGVESLGCDPVGALALGSCLTIAPPTRIDVAHHNSVTSHVTDCNILAGTHATASVTNV